MKRTFSLIIIVCWLFAACQETPEELIVKSKAGEALEENIQKTTNGSTGTVVPNSTENENKEQSEINESYTKHDAVNDSGNISVNIDATVYQPEVGKIPVATVELHKFTQSELDDIVTALVGEAKFLDVNIMTKARLDELIIGIKQNQNDLDSDLAQSNGIKTIAELNDYAEQEIKRLQSMYGEAVDDVSENLIDYIDANTDRANLNTYIDSNGSSSATISYSNKDNSVSLSYRNYGYNNDLRSFTDLAGRPHGELYNNGKQYDINIPYEEANKIALNTLLEMNISNMVLGDVFVTYDPGRLNTSLNEDRSPKELKYYVFCFQRTINNVIVDYSYISSMKSDNDNDVSYSKPLANEYLRMWISSDGVVQFIWGNPLSVPEVLNDSVDISVGLEEAISTMEAQAFIQYADMYGSLADNIVIDIDKITLSLARIRYKGHPGQYIVIPVWDFYGDVAISSDERLPINANLRKTDKDNEYTINNPYQSIITVNALDGTIIDRSLGY